MILSLNKTKSLFRKKARLSRRCWFSERNTHHAENRHLRQGRAWNEDTKCRAVKIGRGDLHSAVEQGKQVVGYDALDAVVVAKFQAYPESVKLWPR